MNDRDMLDVLATEAPVPSADHIGAVLTLAKRARRRRRTTAWGASLGIAAVALIATTLVVQSTAGPDTTHPGSSTSASATSHPPTAEVQAYAAAIRALADQVREGGSPWPVLYVLDHTCANVITPGEGGCDPQPLSAAMRSDLTSALATYAPVQFVADAASVTSKTPEVVNGGALVTLGRIQLNGNDAQVPLSVQRNGLNGRGLTYQLTRDDTTWRVRDTVGPAWIS